jgi:hypothetical protein
VLVGLNRLAIALAGRPRGDGGDLGMDAVLPAAAARRHRRGERLRTLETMGLSVAW